MSKKRIQCVISGKEMDESSNTDTEDEDEDDFDDGMEEKPNGTTKSQQKQTDEVSFEAILLEFHLQAKKQVW